MSKGLPAVVLTVASLLCLPVCSRAASIQALDGGRVDVRAQGVPLGLLLQELGTLVPMNVVAVDPKFLRQPVTVELEGIPLDQAAGRILLETGVDFAVGGLKGQPLRVLVGGSDPDMLVAPLSEKEALAKLEPATKTSAARPQSPQQAKRFQSARMQMKSRRRTYEARTRTAATAERARELVPQRIANDPNVPGGYVMVGDSVTYSDPNFVPYKNRPEVKARREATDVSKIP